MRGVEARMGVRGVDWLRTVLGSARGVVDLQREAGAGGGAVAAASELGWG